MKHGGLEVEKHGGLRDVSFIDEKVKDWLDKEAKEAPERGLCVRRFKADFTVAGLANMKVGDRITILKSEADGKNCSDYEITLMGKRCFPECELFRERGEKCPLATGVAFGKKAGAMIEQTKL